MQITYTLLPGLHGLATLLEPLMKQLGDVKVECIEYPTDIPQSYDSLSSWLSNNVDWTKPRVLVAESFSGPLALRAAEAFPESIQSVVLAASFCNSPTTPNLALLPLRPLLMLKPTRTAIRHFLLGPDSSDDEVNSLRKIVAAIPSRILSQRVRSILKLQAEDCPSIKQTPMLILQAQDDNMIPWETQNQLRMQYPHATTHWLDSPHLILQNNPAESCTFIKQFISQHSNLPTYA